MCGGLTRKERLYKGQRGAAETTLGIGTVGCTDAVSEPASRRLRVMTAEWKIGREGLLVTGTWYLPMYRSRWMWSRAP